MEGSEQPIVQRWGGGVLGWAVVVAFEDAFEVEVARKQVYQAHKICALSTYLIHYYYYYCLPNVHIINVQEWTVMHDCSNTSQVNDPFIELSKEFIWGFVFYRMLGLESDYGCASGSMLRSIVHLQERSLVYIA